jgi:hypothetical protein
MINNFLVKFSRGCTQPKSDDFVYVQDLIKDAGGARRRADVSVYSKLRNNHSESECEEGRGAKAGHRRSKRSRHRRQSPESHSECEEISEVQVCIDNISKLKTELIDVRKNIKVLEEEDLPYYDSYFDEREEEIKEEIIELKDRIRELKRKNKKGQEPSSSEIIAAAPPSAACVVQEPVEAPLSAACVVQEPVEASLSAACVSKVPYTLEAEKSAALKIGSACLGRVIRIRFLTLHELVRDGYYELYQSMFKNECQKIKVEIEEKDMDPSLISPFHPRRPRGQITRPTYAEFYDFKNYCSEMGGYRERGLNAVEEYEKKLNGNRPTVVVDVSTAVRKKLGRPKKNVIKKTFNIPSPELVSSDDPVAEEDIQGAAGSDSAFGAAGPDSALGAAGPDSALGAVRLDSIWSATRLDSPFGSASRILRGNARPVRRGPDGRVLWGTLSPARLGAGGSDSPSGAAGPG